MGIKTDENGQKKLGFRNTEEIDEIFHQNVTDEDKERYLQKNSQSYSKKFKISKDQ
ncbi:hypothetical protein [Apilactobacillus ozensis]|uniref:hypothetical protein n=1 Tax=Apilactobacillus ozensis TaxID=866801 RepID=UPI002092AE0B|nr:hypothetical protein [Apilactobacillus ozensis]